MSALRGVTVLSLEQATTLPFLTYRLACDGARVVRVENAERPDPNRFVGREVLPEPAMRSYFLESLAELPVFQPGRPARLSGGNRSLHRVGCEDQQANLVGSGVREGSLNQLQTLSDHAHLPVRAVTRRYGHLVFLR